VYCHRFCVRVEWVRALALVCVCVRVCVCVCACVRVWQCACVCIGDHYWSSHWFFNKQHYLSLCVRQKERERVCVRESVRVCVCVGVHMCAYMYVCVQVFMRVSAHSMFTSNYVLCVLCPPPLLILLFLSIFKFTGRMWWMDSCDWERHGAQYTSMETAQLDQRVPTEDFGVVPLTHRYTSICIHEHIYIDIFICQHTHKYVCTCVCVHDLFSRKATLDYVNTYKRYGTDFWESLPVQMIITLAILGNVGSEASKLQIIPGFIVFPCCVAVCCSVLQHGSVL